MLATLVNGRFPAADRARWRKLLAVAPWVWPLESDRAYVSTRDFTGHDAPPQPGIGRVLLLTAHASGPGVWLVGGDEIDGAGPPASLEPGALAAWERAGFAVFRSLPVIWTALEPLHNEPPRVVAIHASSMVPNVLRGGSVGLSFLLSQVSRIIGLPVPVHVAASAALTDTGLTVPVGGLAQKIEGLVNVAPRVTHLLVEHDQRDEAEHFAGGRLEIVPVRHAAEAIAFVFRLDDIVAALVPANPTPVQARDTAETFFSLATSIAGRSAVWDWRPVAAAADLASKRVRHLLDDFQRYDLDLARAIACRHRDNSGELAMPPAGWFERYPAPLRTGVLATLVQHAADTTYLPAEELEAMARSALVPPLDAYAPQLKLAGALGRLLAVTGRHEEALGLQEAAARAFQSSGDGQSASYPLSEWFRLAGACGNPQAFEDANRFRAALVRSGGLGFQGNAYVELARARALVQLRPAGATTEAEALLRALAADSRIHPHVRAAACRWLARCRHQDRQSPESWFSGRETEPSTALALLLTRLDAAVAREDVSQGTALVNDLARLQPGPTTHLTRTGPAGDTLPAHIARFFPY